MPKVSTLTAAQNQIQSYFHAAPQRIYSAMELQAVLKEGRKLWRLAKSITLEDFIAFLERNGRLKEYTFRSKRYDRTIVRYAWGQCSVQALAMSFKKRGYLTHGTAAEVHGLLKLSSKTIYLNVEQSYKPIQHSPLTQEGLNRAFSGNQRLSQLSYDHGSTSVTILSGKNTKQLGVEEHVSPASGTLKITNLPRTLIDITVRPAYAGGIDQVLKAYRAAKGKFKVSDLLTLLAKLNYAYPYHQSIGFLMQTASYPEEGYAQLRTPGLNHDFYLDYGMEHPVYAKDWCLFYPRDLIVPRSIKSQVSL